ncbi:asparagine synthase (glutamine-hydrolyzing) [Thiohalomonas denitrificans]|uniref:asparagine synthase (glutamine-hydrolyzing) n=1 Tax=Thiohalomonas denitrificans TaxID=415747 RepID=UPI0026EC93DC|nr:asparagine synthase (glutamine-hydrolyzing) [Thiohalomonas denitrificans]
MCGIAGILNLRQGMPAVGSLELGAMIVQLAHRGPDGADVRPMGPVGLAHARLSIIDLEGGKQPLANEDGSIWVVLNGEIFNFPELRQQLKSAGHSFRTESDTEVIVHLYEDHGEEFVHQLNGQFAIALWDSVKEKLILVRDRVGIAPLFYSQEGDRLFFASEIKAIQPVQKRISRANPAALEQVMTYWAPISPNTMFEGIHELPPGHTMTIENGNKSIRRYWDWSYPPDGIYDHRDEDELAEELRSLLADAVRIRLRSDVPVGAYLSGGLDSSAIAALIRQADSAPLKTFSIGFDQEGYDESDYQTEMVSHLGTQHRSFRCGLSDIAESFSDTVWHAESPLLRTAPTPMKLLSGHVRGEGYKVVLTGEGADEVLGGYDIFKEAKIRQFWARNPDSKFRPALLKRLYPYLNIAGGQSLAYLKQFFGRGLHEPDSPWFSHVPRWTTTEAIKGFFSERMQEHAVSGYESARSLLPAGFERWHWFEKAQYLESKTLMAGYLLCSQGDRMLMANGVEGRYPFLDHRIIEFANRIHPRLKMRGLTEKYLLKKAVGRYLPKRIAQRTKQPYRAPESAPFLSGQTPEFIHEMMKPEKLRDYGYFDPARVAMLQRKMARGGTLGYKDNMAFVGILSTQLWHQFFIENAAMASEHPNLQGSGEYNVHRA